MSEDGSPLIVRQWRCVVEQLAINENEGGGEPNEVKTELQSEMTALHRQWSRYCEALLLGLDILQRQREIRHKEDLSA